MVHNIKETKSRYLFTKQKRILLLIWKKLCFSFSHFSNFSRSSLVNPIKDTSEDCLVMELERLNYLDLIVTALHDILH